MTLTAVKKRKIEEEEKYRLAIVGSITESSTSVKQKHGVPLLLSLFIPGLGQLVKGHIKKGLIIFFAPSVAFILLLIFGFTDGNGSKIVALFGQFWLAGIILYIWQMIDAYNN